ncbi:transporter gate domain-containing protein [Salmonella enterica subsp. enterica serovar Madelia]|nr:transporter gate domain-containing protein [Salmonella enterica subsp. enterica serovar Madelia]
MAQQVDGAAMPLDTEKVGIKGYLAFFLTIIFFSGVFPEAKAGGAFLILPYSTGHSVM